ncbi:hypothetical protein LC593_13815 [Nostoc sp. CHAB 5844]|nr:hypothetical protein [Nostoc sp. CHAB 5844]
MLKLFYEQPSLKKYGTMKLLTSSSNGSRGDALGNTNNVGGSQNNNAASDRDRPIRRDNNNSGSDPDGFGNTTSNNNDSLAD